VSLLIVEVPLLLVQLTCLSFVSDRIRTVRLQCVRGRLTEAAPKEFQEGHLQQSQTIVTEYHKRRRTQSDDKEARKNRVTTKRALDKSDLCTLRFLFFYLPRIRIGTYPLLHHALILIETMNIILLM
jgi:hypothetical protein